MPEFEVVRQLIGIQDIHEEVVIGYANTTPGFIVNISGAEQYDVIKLIPEGSQAVAPRRTVFFRNPWVLL